MILSSVREKQIVVLFRKRDAFEMEIWVTSKITPNTVSWSKFLAVDMKPFITRYYQFIYHCRGFFTDEEKKVLIIISKDKDRNVAFICGEDGYFRKGVDLGETRIAYVFLCSKFRSYQIILFANLLI